MQHTTSFRLRAAGVVALGITLGLPAMARQDVEKPIVVEGGFMTPESVLHDPAAEKKKEPVAK